MENNILFLFYFLLLIKLSSSAIVFPFEVLKEEKNGKINSDDTSYNYKHFINDYFNQLIYINISIGNQPKELKTLITYQECDFKIRNVSECINHNNNIIDINTYTDINSKNKKSCENINIELYKNNFGITDKNYFICGMIGFKMDIYSKKCKEEKNIIHNFYSKGYITNKGWILKYTSKEKGLFILGSNDLKDIIPNYNSENLFKTNSLVSESNFWTFELQKVVCINYTNDNDNTSFTLNKEPTKAQINNDLSLIQGSYSYYSFIEKNYFKKYIDNKICTKNVWRKNEISQYFVFECNKKDFNEKDLKSFPKLVFIGFSGNVKFEFDYKEMFSETKYKYFFNIIFSIYNQDFWIFGKIFLRKYLTIVNPGERTIKVYLDLNKNENNKTNNVEIKKEEEKVKNNKINIKTIFLIILFLCFGFLCFYIGKKVRRERRKKAYELFDDYDYNSDKIIIENNKTN